MSACATCGDTKQIMVVMAPSVATEKEHALCVRCWIGGRPSVMKMERMPALGAGQTAAVSAKKRRAAR
jgi:hypothetical protein